MRELTSYEAIKVLDCIIGKTEAIGDESIDQHRTARLKVLIDITNWCMDGLLYSAEHINAPEDSVRENAQLALSSMAEYQEWCRSMVDEIENERGM